MTPEDAIKAKMRRGEQITPLDHVLTAPERVLVERGLV